jgi:hypothetical protein
MAFYNDRILAEFPGRLSLHEHWKQPMPSSLKCSSSDSATCSSSKKSHRVRFSESSRLHTYHRASISLLQSLSYSTQDRDEFGKDVLLEGMRIKNLIAAAPPASSVESIKYLLRHDIVSIDELIGIEHFILGKPTRVRKIRQNHAAAVLWKQHEQRQQQRNEDPVLSLGKFSEKSSLQSIQSARVRAAMYA